MTGSFLLDSNLLSELMREHPAAAVVDSFALNAHAAINISTLTQAAEILMVLLSFQQENAAPAADKVSSCILRNYLKVQYAVNSLES